MDKTKVIKESKIGTISTGYYDINNGFILHSFCDEPARIFSDGSEYWHKDEKLHRDVGVDENNQPNYLPAAILSNGTKFWYDHGNRYWIIENIRYNSVDEILEKYKDKIIKVDADISQNLTDMNIDYIYLVELYIFLILDDTNRNEIILKYG